MLLQLFKRGVIKILDNGLFDRPINGLYLAIGPGMRRFVYLMLNAVQMDISSKG